MAGSERVLAVLEEETAALGSVELKEKAGAGVSPDVNLKKEKTNFCISIFMPKCKKKASVKGVVKQKKS